MNGFEQRCFIALSANIDLSYELSKLAFTEIAFFGGKSPQAGKYFTEKHDCLHLSS